MSISYKDWGDGISNGLMSVWMVCEVYKLLKIFEVVIIYCSMLVLIFVLLFVMLVIGVDVWEMDDIFFKVFDFCFVNGKLYDEVIFNVGIFVVVIIESILWVLFGFIEFVGKEFLLNYVFYCVVGVVKDVFIFVDVFYG